mmetsp:Transcript_17061/g.39794  ORF Transcript_17061/g.39794 Transcript_17061/m.39794 type:complete len:253 (+) Transcript_17061:260-1018(+)
MLSSSCDLWRAASAQPLQCGQHRLHHTRCCCHVANHMQWNIISHHPRTNRAYDVHRPCARVQHQVRLAKGTLQSRDVCLHLLEHIQHLGVLQQDSPRHKPPHFQVAAAIHVQGEAHTERREGLHGDCRQARRLQGKGRLAQVDDLGSILVGGPSSLRSICCLEGPEASSVNMQVEDVMEQEARLFLHDGHIAFAVGLIACPLIESKKLQTHLRGLLHPFSWQCPVQRVPPQQAQCLESHLVVSGSSEGTRNQ